MTGRIVRYAVFYSVGAFMGAILLVVPIEYRSYALGAFVSVFMVLTYGIIRITNS